MTPTVLTVNPGFGVLKKQADALLFSLYGEVTVSYTHLDVYKRQHQERY